MSAFRYPRPSFTPESLSVFDRIFDEVWTELVSEGTFEIADTRLTRTRLAQKILAFASNGWSKIQIAQLLLRAFRNEVAREKRDKRPQTTCHLASALAEETRSD
jgi:hypothetical protein